MRDIPLLPDNMKGELVKGGGYTKTRPRRWTAQEIQWLHALKDEGFSAREIAKSLERSETSVSIKLKRLGKSSGTYNSKHVAEKYSLNREFLREIKPESILDLYCGEKSFYRDLGATTNDIDENIEADFHCDAFRLICELYYQGRKFDLIDLDPFGSAYDCFDLAVKMANKGLVITLGELGHKRWKRLDYVRRYYGIETMEDFTIQKLIDHIQRIGLRNKKRLIVWQFREWLHIGRVYFKIEKVKITEQWDK